MSVKSSVVEILKTEKEKEVAAVSAKFDALVAAVEALPEEPTGDAELLQKISDLEASVASKDAQIEAAKVAFEEDEKQDEAALQTEQEKVAALQTKLEKIKAALES